MAALLRRGHHREQLVAAGRARGRGHQLEDGDLIEFKAEVDVRPEFELPEFSTLQAQVDALDVPDTLVDQQARKLRNRFGSRETVERPAADGDIVTINRSPAGRASRWSTRQPTTWSTPSARVRC